MTSKFSIHLFGQPEVLTESGSTAPGLGLGKPLAVLCYLIIEGRSSREEVMDLLWGEMPEAKARNAFRQALHRLRTSLGENIIPHDPEMVFFSDSVEMATDVDRFETFLRDGDVESAISEYRGEFLSGLNLSEPAFDAWQESKRKKYRARFRDALRDLIQAALEAGDVHRALQRATMLADLDPMDSEAVMLFATTLLGAGRRAEALHALE
jgi:DNA-binding transcriptional activator of the SARP family